MIVGVDERNKVLLTTTPFVGVKAGDYKVITLKQVPRILQVDRTVERRPLVGGISIGHWDITAGCLTKDTLVLSNPEVKPIIDFREGDKVYSFSENGLVVRRVKRIFDNGVKDVYLMKTQTGREIKATMNHHF